MTEKPIISITEDFRVVNGRLEYRGNTAPLDVTMNVPDKIQKRMYQFTLGLIGYVTKKDIPVYAPKGCYIEVVKISTRITPRMLKDPAVNVNWIWERQFSDGMAWFKLLKVCPQKLQVNEQMLRFTLWGVGVRKVDPPTS